MRQVAADAAPALQKTFQSSPPYQLYQARGLAALMRALPDRRDSSATG